MSQLSDRSESYWNARSENLKELKSDRSNNRKQMGRRLSNGRVNGSYKPRSQLPQLNRTSGRSVDSPVRGGRYTIVPPVSANSNVRGNADRQRKTAWTQPPVESSHEGRVPQPQVPNVPRVVDNTKYRNYLKKRYPRIAAIEDEVRDITPEVYDVPSPKKPQTRPRMKKPKPPAPPSPRQIDRNETLESYTFFCEHAAFASQYVGDLIIRFLDEEIISDVLVDAIQESLSEKMFVSTTDLFTYWIENPMFADDFVDTLIDRTIEDEVIPDILIDVISRARPSARQASDSAAIEIYHQLLRDIIPESVRDISMAVVTEYNTSQYVIQQAHYSEVYASSLLNEFVITASRTVVREVVLEVANEERLNAIYFDVMYSVFVEFMKENGPALVTEAYADAVIEIFFEKEILNEVLFRDSEAVAVEVLTHYDTQLRRKDLEEIMKLGREKPVATIALDHCLSLLSSQDAVRSHNAVYNKNLEGVSLEAILDRYDDIRSDFSYTFDNKAVKRFHEKATLDVAVEVLANELIAHADEDLADLDFAEVDKNHIPRYVKDIDSTFYGSVDPNYS